MSDSDHQTYTTLEDVLRIVRSQARLIVVIVVIATVGTYLVVTHQAKRYTASADLVFDQNQGSQELSGVTPAQTDETAQQETNVDIVTLGPTARQAAKAIGGGVTARTIRGAINASAEAESNIVQLSATARSPRLAAEIANTYADLFVRNQISSAEASFSAAQQVVEQQLRRLSPAQRNSGAGADLEARAQSLAELAQLQAGIVQVAQTAGVPSEPSSPKVKRDTAIGLVLGLLLGLFAGFARDRLDRTIRTPEDLESLYGLPLLSVIPQSKSFVSGQSGFAQSGDLDETFRLMRAHLRYFNIGRTLRVIAVVSAAPGDGKSTIARYLARAAAMSGSRVLLVEADLRRPTSARAFGLAAGVGLPDILIGRTDLEQATHRVYTTSPDDSDTNAVGTLDVLLAGVDSPPNPAQLLESTPMRDFLRHVRENYDFVVIDTPPLTLVPDVFPILTEVDGVLIVGRLGHNNRGVATRLRRVLEGTDAVLLGVVANGLRIRGRNSYEYGYSRMPPSKIKADETPTA